MSMAFTFVALSPALTSFRDQMSESYSDCSWQPVAHPPSHPLHPGLSYRAPRAAYIHPVEPRAASCPRGRRGCPDRTNQGSHPVITPPLCVHPTGLGQLNSSNPKEMSWRKRMAHLLTTGASSVGVAG